MASQQANNETQQSLLNSTINAAHDGQFSLVQKLIADGCDVRQRDGNGWSALTHALAVGHWDIFLLLSKAYCHQELKSKKKAARLVTSMERGHFQELVKIATSNNVFKGWTKQENAALLFLAINHNCPPDVLAMLIRDKCDVTMNYHCGMTALVFATVVGNHETLEAILSHNPDLHTRDALGKSAMAYGVEKGCSKCLEMLLNTGVLNRFALGKATKLSIVRGQGACFLVLLKWSIKHNLLTESTDSLLCEAALTGSLKCLNILLDHGADASWANSKGETALMFSAIKGHNSCLDRLLQHDVRVNAVDFEGNTALMHAVQWAHPECVTKLLEFGADVNVVNTSKMTAISMACLQHGTNILQRILNISGDSVHIGLHGMAFKFACKFCNINALLSLMGNGIFLWRWMGLLDNVPLELVAATVVKSGIRPSIFWSPSCGMTLLRFSFRYSNYETIRFLLANHYLTDYDVKVLPRDKDFISSIRRNDHPQTVALLNQFTTQPWSLQSLSFLAISSAINASSSETDPPRRQNTKVEQLPLPEKFITRLLFRSSLAQMCVDQWKHIGIQTREGGMPNDVNLLSNMSPMWKDFELPQKCEQGKCHHNEEGFRMRFHDFNHRNNNTF